MKMHSSNFDKSSANSLKVVTTAFCPVLVVFASSEDNK